MKIELEKIKPSAKPIRVSFDENKLNELASSIREQKGLIVPIKVRPVDGGYEVIYGHRRLEAAKRAGLLEIECIVEDADNTNTLVQGLIENVMREDMTPIDTARALQRLQEETKWSNLEVERQGIMGNHQVSMLLALLNEAKEVQELVVNVAGNEIPEGKITESHVRAVRQVLENSISDRTPIINKAAHEGLTVAQTRQVAEDVKEANKWGGQNAVDLVIKRPYSDYKSTYVPSIRKQEEHLYEPELSFSWFKQQRVTEMLDAVKIIGAGIGVLMHPKEDSGTAKILLKQIRSAVVRWLEMIDEGLKE